MVESSRLVMCGVVCRFWELGDTEIPFTFFFLSLPAVRPRRTPQRLQLHKLEKF